LSFPGPGLRCGLGALLVPRTQLILSPLRHRLSAMRPMRPNSGIGWAIAMKPTKEEELLRESLDRLVDLGAEAAARLVRRTMRHLGLRSIPAGARTAARTHPRGLTRREQEILELVSSGQSNDEISERLFISVRTVEHHVSAILGKLGATTRKGAAKEARRLGLAEPDQVSVGTKSR
jgi:DNA-binding CsgD family transcriptional regulator